MLSAKQRPFCIDHNVSSVMLAKLSSTKQSSVCWRTGHSLIGLLTESLTHLLTDWITNWLIDCLIDWLAHPCLGSIKNRDREDCYTRWTPRNKYSILFLICSVTMGWSKWNLPWKNRDVDTFGLLISRFLQFYIMFSEVWYWGLVYHDLFTSWLNSELATRQ